MTSVYDQAEYIPTAQWGRRSVSYDSTTTGEEDFFSRSPKSVDSAYVEESERGISSAILRVTNPYSDFYKNLWISSAFSDYFENIVIIFEGLEEQLYSPGESVASSISSNPFLLSQDDYEDTRGGIFPITVGREKIFSKEFEFKTSELSRLKPNTKSLFLTVDVDDE